MQGALTAFDVNTGAVKWSWKGDGPGYGSPIIADFGGTRQIVTITQGKLVSVDAATGALLWERPYVSANFTNSVTPVALRSDAHRLGQRRIRRRRSTVKKQNNQWVDRDTAWENADIPHAHEQRGDRRRRALRPVDAGTRGSTSRVDAKTGKTLWTSEGRAGGQAAIAQRRRSGPQPRGRWRARGVARSSKTAFEPCTRYKVADSATWTQAAYSGNRIFVKDVSTLTLWTTN